eukprot:CAMPEP_0194058902 /NCGR_PEP_ID=MMETSP0009_2-20130614/67597_1 /TAXON_ID=210454 /ORGANISM="Grammatophora oceanica, Strain CCMP 410" /LENGTH=115 /DNA_ID=CAMNT_0038709225 /DNA_START=71 /DNA_END=418 /DNA_ORIENTATION=-
MLFPAGSCSPPQKGSVSSGCSSQMKSHERLESSSHVGRHSPHVYGQAERTSSRSQWSPSSTRFVYFCRNQQQSRGKNHTQNIASSSSSHVISSCKTENGADNVIGEPSSRSSIAV